MKQFVNMLHTKRGNYATGIKRTNAAYVDSVEKPQYEASENFFTATLAGRFGSSEYGRSRKAGEELFFRCGKKRT